MFPFIERKFLRFFPKRAQSHRELKKFMTMIQEIINRKKEVLKQRKDRGEDVDDESASEKDLLQLMIESRQSEHAGLSDEELLVNILVLIVNYFSTKTLFLF